MWASQFCLAHLGVMAELTTQNSLSLKTGEVRKKFFFLNPSGLRGITLLKIFCNANTLSAKFHCLPKSEIFSGHCYIFYTKKQTHVWFYMQTTKSHTTKQASIVLKTIIRHKGSNPARGHILSRIHCQLTHLALPIKSQNISFSFSSCYQQSNVDEEHCHQGVFASLVLF